MTHPDLTGKRVLILGAETEIGRAVATALAEARARIALVAATADAEAAFAVKRLATRLSATAQAVDATNEMAVRVMVRQIAKQLGGLDAFVYCASRADGLPFAALFGGKELARARGVFVAAGWEIAAAGALAGVRTVSVLGSRSDIADEAVRAVAGESASG